MKKVFLPARASERGMTLIEVSIALLVMGVIIGGALAFYTSADKQRRLQKTYDNMDRIVRALSVYAESAGRVPCPANPGANNITFGWEWGVTSNDLQLGSGKYPTGSCGNTGGNPTEGILPFMTLNLDDSAARDGWNRYFTYAVSPQFARSNDQSHNTGGSINTNADVGSIHGRCRSEGWAGRYDGHNISAVKARFCCADQGSSGGTGGFAVEPWNPQKFENNTDLIIQHTAGGTLSPLRSLTTATAGMYQFMTVTNTGLIGGNTLPQAMKNEANTRILAPAFVLISHGLDGAGAYLANGSNGRYNPAGLSAAESQNADYVTATPANKLIYTDGPANLAAGNNYYDDIVRWMTQDALMAAHGALSCQYP